jgi:transposase
MGGARKLGPGGGGPHRQPRRTSDTLRTLRAAAAHTIIGLPVSVPKRALKRGRSFPEAFKREAVAAIRGGRSVSQVAAELGLPDRLVRSWLRWAEGRAPVASGVPTPTPPREGAAPARRVGPSPADGAAEIARLRKELERVRIERDILKRAALIFGQATDRR